MASFIEEQNRDALAAEINLYIRLIAWRDMQSLRAGRDIPDACSTRIFARLTAAQRLWRTIDHSKYDIPF